VDDVDTNVEVHGKGVNQSAIPNVVTAADVEGSGDGGVAKEVRQPTKDKDAGKEMTAAPASDMEVLHLCRTPKSV